MLRCTLHKTGRSKWAGDQGLQYRRCTFDSILTSLTLRPSITPQTISPPFLQTQQIDRVVEVVEETLKGNVVRFLGQRKEGRRKTGTTWLLSAGPRGILFL